MESKIIHAITKVYGLLEYGLTESIYQKALLVELRKHFETVEIEKSIPIIYEGHEIAILRADIVIDNKFIIELKAIATKLTFKEESQIKRYMKILNINKGILVNFGKELQIKEISL